MHRLTEADVYVTLEPSAMCVGMMIQARLWGLFVGCRDPKAGQAISLYQRAG